MNAAVKQADKVAKAGKGLDRTRVVRVESAYTVLHESK
jgi:hypothetical protein